jgi:hypothetical protein
MYSWTWRHLPGPLVARLLQVLVLLAAAVALLFFVIFPAVEPLLPYNDVTVGNSDNTAPGPSLHITSHIRLSPITVVASRELRSAVRIE